MSSRSPARRAPLRARMREQVSEAILDAAEEVLANRGLEGASTAAIAERAGVAVGTLYNYFPDREALIDSLFKARRAEMLPPLTEAVRAAAREPQDRRLRAYVAAVLDVFEEQRAFMRVVIAMDPKHHGARGGKSPVILSTIVDGLTDILRPEFGKLSPEYARMIVGAMKSLIPWRVENNEPFAPDVDLIVDTFTDGMVRR